MSSPGNTGGWADRRGLFQSGKVVHEPARRPSIPKAVLPLTAESPTSPTKPASTGSTAERRRSSVSGSTGMFANLHSHKRGSEDYGQRRQNWDEMNTSKGAIGGLFDKIIKK